MPQVTCHQMDLESPLTLYYTGPDLSAGPLPALFYFALSGEESLTLDPFNQPVTALSGTELRVFSVTLPGHEEGKEKTKAIGYWAEQIRQGNTIIDDLVQQVIQLIDQLIERQIVDPDHLAVAGLSRGGLVATHLAAQDKRIRHLLGFAPMTKASYHKEFASFHQEPLVQALDLIHLVDKLHHVNLRFYIGNRDLRVGTTNCYSFIEALTNSCFEAKIRSPQVELIIGPSVGHQGHGTAPDVFENGATWIKQSLLKDAS